MPKTDKSTAHPGVPPQATGSAPSFYRWRIRKELPDGMFSRCEYNGRVPVTADHVRNAPSVREWLGTDKLDEIYTLNDPAEQMIMRTLLCNIGKR
jgi:hypothetical protein